MPTPTTHGSPGASGVRRLARPGVCIVAGSLAVAGAALGWLIHPAWATLAVLGGLTLLLVPDPTH